MNFANGIHSTQYQRFIMKGLLKVEKAAIKNGDNVEAALRRQLQKWKRQFEEGEVFWNKVGENL